MILVQRLQHCDLCLNIVSRKHSASVWGEMMSVGQLLLNRSSSIFKSLEPTIAGEGLDWVLRGHMLCRLEVILLECIEGSQLGRLR